MAVYRHANEPPLPERRSALANDHVARALPKGKRLAPPRLKLSRWLFLFASIFLVYFVVFGLKTPFFGICFGLLTSIYDALKCLMKLNTIIIGFSKIRGFNLKYIKSSSEIWQY